MKMLVLGIALISSVSAYAANFSYRIEGDVGSVKKFILQNKIVDLSKCSEKFTCDGSEELFITNDKINVFLLASHVEPIHLKVVLTDNADGKEVYSQMFGSNHQINGSLHAGGQYEIGVNDTFDW